MTVFRSDCEAEYCQELIGEFKADGYLPALVVTVVRGGFTNANMPFLFELRYAKSLKDRNITPEYERKTVGETSVDFTFKTERGALVHAEVVSIQKSKAVRGATHDYVDDGGQWSKMSLSSDNSNKKFSVEGETLLVQQKLCAKLWQNGHEIKFPAPNDASAFNVLIVDMRGFLGGNGCDHGDCVQLCCGNRDVHEIHMKYWTDPITGNSDPILGLFEQTDRPRGVQTLRNRLHGILFVNDTEYRNGSIKANSLLIRNPHLITTDDQNIEFRNAVLGR